MSGQLLSSKVVVVEEEPRVRGIPSAPTSVAGAVGVTERGPVGKAVLVNSFEEFQQRFGGFTKDSDLALAAMGFFENGGSQLWVVRTVHYTDVSDPATATAVRASGYLTTPGAPTPAVVTGAIPAPFRLEDGDRIVLSVGGGVADVGEVGRGEGDGLLGAPVEAQGERLPVGQGEGAGADGGDLGGRRVEDFFLDWAGDHREQRWQPPVRRECHRAQPHRGAEPAGLGRCRPERHAS